MTAEQFQAIVALLTRQAEAWEKIAASVAAIATALQSGAERVGTDPPPNAPVIAQGPRGSDKG